jgi:fluoroacetyl-CoA thioesterase
LSIKIFFAQSGGNTMAIEAGLVHEITTIVEESDTARITGGESLPAVFSTPRMISFMERTAHYGVLPHLQEGQTTVGTVVNVRHLAATPAGMEVRFRAELVEVDRRRLRFKVEAWDALEKVGEGEHERFIVEMGRFNEKLDQKQKMVDR